MINKQTIISVFDDKLTLMQWLKKVENALNGAVLTGVELKKKGNATFAWSFDFEDGTHVDTDYVTINEGESVAEAYLLNGHLMIKLTNDEVIDAGNLKPVTSFSFNTQRHLIVNYGDGTSEDLGLIKGVSSFSISNNGHLIANYDDGTTQDVGTLGDFSNVDFVTKTLTQNEYTYSRSFNMTSVKNIDVTNIYNIFGVINNVLHCIVNFSLKNNNANAITFGQGYGFIGVTNLSLDQAVAEKIFDFDGKAVSDPTSTSGTLIASIPCQLFKNKVMSDTSAFIDARLTLVNRGSANGLSIQVSLIGGTTNRITLEPNEELFITGRVALTLING